jgi:hypothetical protein
MDDAGHRVAANPCGSHPDRQEQPDDITGSLIVLLTTALHPKEPEQVPNVNRQARLHLSGSLALNRTPNA